MPEDAELVPPYHLTLQSIAAQLMNGSEVVIDGEAFEIKKAGRRLRSARVTFNGRELTAIEQNPDKPSHWAKLARKGHQVVQFQDMVTKKYVAVVVDGDVTEYGR